MAAFILVIVGLAIAGAKIQRAKLKQSAKLLHANMVFTERSGNNEQQSKNSVFKGIFCISE